jgi:hypothetical protein
MSFWIVVSWIAVLILTVINIFVFLKLKQASEQMMKMAFPNAKNMGDAMAQMQKMMGGMQGRPGFGGAGKGGAMDAQLAQAMKMLNQAQKRK